METHYPGISGDIEAYKLHVWAALQLTCDDCDQYVVLTNDIVEDEYECPEGIWQVRRAKFAMSEGWYVHPLSADGGLTGICLCPNCRKQMGLKIFHG